MITIKFKEHDLARYLAALEKIRASVTHFGMDEMQRRCAIDYYQLVMQNIMKRTSPRPAYSVRYRNWKYEYGWMGYPSPWRLKGDLVNSLTAFRSAGSQKGWIGGVPIGAMDSGGKSWLGKGSQGARGGSRPIALYGKAGEYGRQGGKQPARPVFGPSADEYAGEGWIRRGAEALNELKAQWA
jgi:hypothetical protein